MRFFEGTHTALVTSTRPSASSAWTRLVRSIDPVGAPPSATCVVSTTRILLRVKRSTYPFLHDGTTIATGSAYGEPPSFLSSPVTLHEDTGTHGCFAFMR